MNPFTKGSTQYVDFETMSDLEWHCSKCELQSGQAKTWQVWKQEKGIQMKEDEAGNYFIRLFCNKCKKNTVHRGLSSLEILDHTKTRSGIPPQIVKRVKELYENTEAFEGRKMQVMQLEVDHRFPQVRWGENEQSNTRLNDMQLREKFILLTNSHNLLKARICEHCKTSNERGSFPGIEYWYVGNKNWDNKYKEYDSTGCIGCFWFDPFSWRDELQKIIDKSK